MSLIASGIIVVQVQVVPSSLHVCTVSVLLKDLKTHTNRPGFATHSSSPGFTKACRVQIPIFEFFLFYIQGQVTACSALCAAV